MTEERFIFIPPGGPPGPIPGLQTVFDAVGENRLRDLVSNFYDQISLSPIAFMFPEVLEESKIKSADFLIQVTGGPFLYSRNYGSPRMRARHLPFPIDEKARRIWLSCYRKALDDWEVDASIKEILWSFFKDFSAWMVNLESKTEEEDGSKNNSRAKILVRGKVQGVGFRYYILQRAQECRLSGYTQNLPGGEVETVVEGDKVFIEDLYKAIQKGPKGSEIKEALINWEDPKGNFRTFEIKK